VFQNPSERPKVFDDKACPAPTERRYKLKSRRQATAGTDPDPHKDFRCRAIRKTVDLSGRTWTGSGLGVSL
jgi:hypothetical protein